MYSIPDLRGMFVSKDLVFLMKHLKQVFVCQVKVYQQIQVFSFCDLRYLDQELQLMSKQDLLHFFKFASRA